MTTPPQRPGHEGGAGPGDEHPPEHEVDALLDADLVQVRDRAGAQGPPPEALVAAHVLGCERCQGVLADMRGVRGMLRARAAGAPPPPADLQARIAAAVAEDTARGRSQGRRRRRRTALALAASGVLVAGLGTAVALSAGQVLGDGATDRVGSASGAGSDAGAGDVAGEETSSTGAPLQVMASGTDYEPGAVAAQLDDAVTRPLAAAGPDGTPQDASTPDRASQDGTGEDGGAGAGRGRAPEDDRRRLLTEALAPTEPSGLADPARLSGCLEDLGRAGAVVLVVDTARWEGEPADVLVVSAPGGSTSGDGDAAPSEGSPLGRPLQVWVVAPGCAGGEAGLRHFEVLEQP